MCPSARSVRKEAPAALRGEAKSSREQPALATRQFSDAGLLRVGRFPGAHGRRGRVCARAGARLALPPQRQLFWLIGFALGRPRNRGPCRLASAFADHA